MEEYSFKIQDRAIYSGKDKTNLDGAWGYYSQVFGQSE